MLSQKFSLIIVSYYIIVFTALMLNVAAGQKLKADPENKTWFYVDGATWVVLVLGAILAPAPAVVARM